MGIFWEFMGWCYMGIGCMAYYGITQHYIDPDPFGNKMPPSELEKLIIAIFWLPIFIIGLIMMNDDE